MEYVEPFCAYQVLHLRDSVTLESTGKTLTRRQGSRGTVSQLSPEERLLARVARHERDALAELYERFQRPLFTYLFHLLGQKELAEDVLQEVMVIVWQNAGDYRGAAPVARWLFGIAHHQAYKALRREPGAHIELDAALYLADETLDPEADLLRQTAHNEVSHALALLTPEHREVLELTFFQDFACKEVAAIVGIPVGTVKSRLTYARRALKAILAREGLGAEQLL